MRSLTIIFCAALALFSFQPARATIIHVPADSSTIQGGINGAVNGDTVLVAPGVYYEHINFHGKAILVKSEAGPQTTAITRIYDGMSLVSFVSGEDTTSVLDGFTITGGHSGTNDGGGVYSDSSSPKIRNNIFSGNSAHDGGGCYCRIGHPVLEANTFIGNTANGGGVHIVACSAIIRDNQFLNNSGKWGAGLFIRQSNGTVVERNLILSNNATLRGGGIAISMGGSHVLANNTIVNNSSPEGGGVCLWYTDSNTLFNNIITGNWKGYGIWSYESSNSVIEYNNVRNNSPADYDGISPGTGGVSADLNCDHVVDLADLVYLINYLFRDGPPPDCR